MHAAEWGGGWLMHRGGLPMAIAAALSMPLLDAARPSPQAPSHPPRLTPPSPPPHLSSAL